MGRRILVTSALPYANGPIHLGHLVEYLQTDIWVRFQKMRGHDCLYVCADDAHGTPIMLKARESGVTPEDLIAAVGADHQRDFAAFGVDFDHFHTTHSPENLELTTGIYKALTAAGHITRRTIEQAYDEQEGMFLPDRYVKGTCPVCATEDQSGDSCENCGATYAPVDLIDPISVLSGKPPTVKSSEHFFFKLGDFEDMLRAWVPDHVDASLARKLTEWFDAGLKDWDISRDAPYFGFEIPDAPGKYFYVWLDAPVGYMASLLHYARSNPGVDFDAYWGKNSEVELYHFLGKDIVYFHALFWPAVLAGSGYRTPSGIFAHGFLTVDGQKMSKRRGTFITAETYLEHLAPDYLRYYYAAKLGPTIDDIDLNLEDFVARVNSDLVGKLVNIASRCAGFVQRCGDGRLADRLAAPDLFAAFVTACDGVAEYYERREYSKAMRVIMSLADQANQYIDEHKPWIMAKTAGREADIVAVCSVGLNLFRVLIGLLKPVLPQLAARAEAFLAIEPLRWAELGTPLLAHRIERFQPLLQRVEPQAVQQMVAQARAAEPPPPAALEPIAAQIDLKVFDQVDLRVARVLAAEHVGGADKLLRLQVDLGGEQREILAGIRSAYQPEALVGRLVIVVANLKPRKMRFGVSEGMVLAAGPGGSDIYLLSPDSDATPGMRVH